jgi:CBS domain-containing protein
MAENGVGSLVVIDGRGHAKGVVTRAQLSGSEARSRPTMRLTGEPGQRTRTQVVETLRRVSVDKLVPAELVSLVETDTVQTALALMERHGLTHLPVLREGLPVGILARSDLENLIVLRNRN